MYFSPGHTHFPTPSIPQVTPAKVDEACAKAKAGHFQLACAAVWEGKHGCSCETGINHPNQVIISRVRRGTVSSHVHL